MLDVLKVVGELFLAIITLILIVQLGPILLGLAIFGLIVSVSLGVPFWAAIVGILIVAGIIWLVAGSAG